MQKNLEVSKKCYIFAAEIVHTNLFNTYGFIILLVVWNVGKRKKPSQRGGKQEIRRFHVPEVGGSNPLPATQLTNTNSIWKKRTK